MTRTEGLTLTEVLVVIAILALIAAVLLPTLSGAQRLPYDDAARTCLNTIQAESRVSRQQLRVWPSQTSALGAAVREACQERGVRVSPFDQPPTAQDPDTGQFMATSNGPAFYAWHPNGSAAYGVNPAVNLTITVLTFP